MKIPRILILSAIPWLSSCDRSTEPESVETPDPMEVEVLADAYESDDSVTSSKPIGTNGHLQARTLHGTSAASQDIDWVVFATDTGFSYAVRQVSTNPDRVEIRCDSGNWIDSTIDSQFQTSEGTYERLVSFTPRKPGHCYAIISGPKGSEYQISVLATNGEVLYAPDAWEPDDAKSIATILSLDSTWQDHTLDGLYLRDKPVTTTPDVDWFQFQADSGTTARILFEGNTRILRTVIDPNGDTATVLRNEIPILKSGTWTIVVRATGDMLGDFDRFTSIHQGLINPSPYVTGLFRWVPYRIALVQNPGIPSWTFEVHEADDHPIRDSALSYARSIPSDSSPTDRWLLENDKDYFEFDAKAGRSYSMQVEQLEILEYGTNGSNFPPNFVSFDSIGIRLESDLSMPIRRFPYVYRDIHIARTDGKVFIELYQDSRMGRYRYRLRLWSVETPEVPATSP